jgi:methylmalonyl-CoA/ethylmalonyl-CoA epimerase
MTEETPALKRIDHIGVVVDDLERVSGFLRDVLGLQLSRTLDDPERRVRANFFRCGDVDIELVELGDPAAREQRLGQSTARVEHIAIEVDDIAATAGQLGERGVRMNTDEPVRGAPTLSYWSLPQTSGGIMLQLLQRIQT